MLRFIVCGLCGEPCLIDTVDLLRRFEFRNFRVFRLTSQFAGLLFGRIGNFASLLCIIEQLFRCGIQFFFWISGNRIATAIVASPVSATRTTTAATATTTTATTTAAATATTTIRFSGGHVRISSQSLPGPAVDHLVVNRFATRCLSATSRLIGLRGTAGDQGPFLQRKLPLRELKSIPSGLRDRRFFPTDIGLSAPILDRVRILGSGETEPLLGGNLHVLACPADRGRMSFGIE